MYVCERALAEPINLEQAACRDNGGVTQINAIPLCSLRKIGRALNSRESDNKSGTAKLNYNNVPGPGLHVLISFRLINDARGGYEQRKICLSPRPPRT